MASYIFRHGEATERANHDNMINYGPLISSFCKKKRFSRNEHQAVSPRDFSIERLLFHLTFSLLLYVPGSVMLYVMSVKFWKGKFIQKLKFFIYSSSCRFKPVWPSFFKEFYQTTLIPIASIVRMRNHWDISWNVFFCA